MKVEVIGLRLLMEMAILRGGGVCRPGTGLALMESSSIAELQRVGGLRPISFVEERCCYSSFWASERQWPTLEGPRGLLAASQGSHRWWSGREKGGTRDPRWPRVRKLYIWQMERGSKRKLEGMSYES